jgi:hypothetical protein
MTLWSPSMRSRRGPSVVGQCGGNVCIDIEVGDAAGATAEAFARGAHVVRLEIGAQRVTGVSMEPRTNVADTTLQPVATRSTPAGAAASPRPGSISLRCSA